MRTLYISASQLESAELCLRKWWLRYGPCKSKEPPRAFHGFGNVLHGCAERYLKEPPEDPFCVDWDVDTETKTRLLPADAALVRVLIEEAISSGVVERRPGAEPELKFTVAHDDPEITSVIVMITGKIDYVDAAEVQDHKHSKSVRYFKSAEGLKKSLQMMLYAKFLIDTYRKRGMVPPQIITLRHNQFLKDLNDPMTRKRSAEVTPREIDEFWKAEVIPLIRRMVAVLDETNPFAIPDPPKEACNAYGGCPRVPLCSGGEDLLTHTRRMDRLQTPRLEQPMTSLTPNDFLASRMGGAPPAAAAATINPPPPSTNGTVAPTTSPVVQAAAPPWAWGSCPLCSKKPAPGFNNDTKKPCRVCLSSGPMKMQMADLEAQFVWSVDAGGKISWSSKASGATVAQTTTPAATTAPAKVAYGMQDLLLKLRAATTVEQVIAVLGEAVQLLGADEQGVMQAAAEKRIDEIEAGVKAPAPAPTPAPTEMPYPQVMATIDLIGKCNSIDEIQAALKNAAHFHASASQMAFLEGCGKERLSKLPPPAATVVAPPLPAPATSTAESSTTPSPKPGRGRRRATPAAAGAAPAEGEAETGDGLTLLINCSALVWDGPVVPAESVLDRIEGYWSNQDVFKRRDQLRASATAPGSELIKSLINLAIVQSVPNPDVDNLMSCLIPHASRVIRGTM